MPLTRDPLADEWWTISQACPSLFKLGQEANDISIHQLQLVEVQYKLVLR